MAEGGSGGGGGGSATGSEEFMTRVNSNNLLVGGTWRDGRGSFFHSISEAISYHERHGFDLVVNIKYFVNSLLNGQPAVIFLLGVRRCSKKPGWVKKVKVGTEVTFTTIKTTSLQPLTAYARKIF
jgi:hypothetical protein